MECALIISGVPDHAPLLKLACSSMENPRFYLVPLALAVYYLAAKLLSWSSRKGSVVIQYQPPAGLSPAAMRYLFTLNVDSRTFAAILTQLALQGLIAIVPDKSSRIISIRKLINQHQRLESLAPEEKLVLKSLFEWDDVVELKTPESRLMEKIQECLQPTTNKYVMRNLFWAGLAVLGSGVGVAWMVLSMEFFGNDKFGSYTLAGFTGFTVAMFSAASAYMWDRNFPALNLALRGIYHRRAIGVLLFFILIYPALWFFLMRSASPIFANVTGLLILINMVAAPLLRSFTREGRAVINQICGFRQFLERAERDHLEKLNPTDQPIQVGQKYLPYAIALDVRESWGDQLGIKTMIETAL